MRFNHILFNVQKRLESRFVLLPKGSINWMSLGRASILPVLVTLGMATTLLSLPHGGKNMLIFEGICIEKDIPVKDSVNS